MVKKPTFRRILLKLSGEALSGKSGSGIDSQILERLSKQIAAIVKSGVEVGIVIGGGNLFRARALTKTGISQVTSDHLGMLATVMNAIAMREVFERHKIDVRVMSAIPVRGIAEHYDRLQAIRSLKKGRVVIFAGGTGNPLVTTDSAASLRGIEIDADVILKATNVDGVYSADPAKNKNAKLYKKLTFREAIQKELAVMDITAFCQCRDHGLRIKVFNVNKKDALLNVVAGKDEGTLVEGE